MTRRETVPAKLWHAMALTARAAEGLSQVEPIADAFRFSSEKWAILSDGMPVCVFGFIQIFPRRWELWGLVDLDGFGDTRFAMREFWRITKGMGRIECTVRVGFEKGHALVKALGFTAEAPLMRGYGPDGEDHVGYVGFF